MSNQPQLPLHADEASYFTRRMMQLGIMPEMNSIELWQSAWVDNADNTGKENKNVLKPFSIFRQTPRGIDILCYTLDRNKIYSYKDAQRSGVTVKAVDKDYCITRLEHPKGSQKYDKPAKQPSYPFFPPGLVTKYEKCKEFRVKNPDKPFPAKIKIKALYLTEGFFKAFKADMHGINCVGLQSITCLREKDTNTIWSDITELVKTCEVEHLVFLTDGDFMNITSADLKEGIDLYQRPASFYDSAFTFRAITSSLPGEKYFGHINTDTLEGNPKGLDDVLCGLTDTADMAIELNNFSIMAPGKIYPGKYITRINISIDTGKVREYMRLNDVTAFYLYHVEKRPVLKEITTFKFYRTTYRYNEKEGKCEVEIPGNAADYIRMGNDYYKKIMVPDKKAKPMAILAGRAKGTIVDDHGKEFITYIKKYEAPCIVPDHFNHQPVIHNCYNLYNPFIHPIEEGDCSNTIDFFKHIFGERKVRYEDKDTQVVKHIPCYELGLDYYTILYKYPWHILPILCCVSRERQTGKTTLHDYTDELFKGNSINIGNEDLEADFNAHWAGKLVIKVDETKVEKGRVVDKVKRLSTASNIILNAKGKDQTTLPFFAKFMLNSNHVEDFIKIDKEENRFWIHQVKPIKDLKPDFLETLIEEIPAFLHYLNTREMVSERKERHWFDEQLLQTDALKVIKENSTPTMERNIRTEIQELFEMCDNDTLYFPLENISKEVLKGAIKEKVYIKRILADMGIKNIAAKRGKFPRRIEVSNNQIGELSNKEICLEWIDFNTSCFEFHRHDFINNPDISNAKIINNNEVTTNNSTNDDLPF